MLFQIKYKIQALTQNKYNNLSNNDLNMQNKANIIKRDNFK